MNATPVQLRPVEVVRAGWGAALLTCPGLVLQHVHRVRVDTASQRVTRVLGARQLGQALLSGVAPSPEVLAMGVWVDAAHAATAVAFSLSDRTRWRAGVTDAVIAAVWAAFGYRDLVHARGVRPEHDRRRDAAARLVLRHVPGGAALLRRTLVDRRSPQETT
ncbi:hypothetical protein ACXR2U_06365 [Jatrophihabitans sp. YIM 134969]